MFKFLCIFLVTLTLSSPVLSLQAQQPLSTDEIVTAIRVQTDVAAATATLSGIGPSITYADIYPMLAAGLNENTQYPIPNALLDRILEQFTDVAQGDMDTIAGTLVRFDNKLFDRLEGYLSFFKHEKIESTGLFQLVSSLNQHHYSVDVKTRKRLITAIYDTQLYQSDDLMSESFRKDIFTNVAVFFIDENGVIDDDLAELFFRHISRADDRLLADIVTGFHKGTIIYGDSQQALENIVAFDNCSDRCHGNIIQLITYNENIELRDRDTIAMRIAQGENTSDYILGEVTTAAWDARTPLTMPEALLEAVQSVKAYGPQAKLKMEQARRNMQ